MSDITRDYSFGGWLKHFRVQKGITLRRAAKLLDTDAGNYCKLENSRIAPPKNRKSVERILRAFDAEEQIEFMVSLAFQDHVATLRKRFK